MLKGLSSWFTPASKWVVIPGMTGQNYGGYYHGWSIPAYLPETSQEQDCLTQFWNLRTDLWTNGQNTTLW